ncbi:MAG: hypothetical protein JWM87_3859 [Candidatus Eremiobacteraeota bacterium]|nr:hypothetical protein [Candidatus Eremiobacteraeota bacterium]
MIHPTRRQTAAGLVVACAVAACTALNSINTMSSADVPAVFNGIRPQISYELSDTPAALTPRERAAWWMKKNKSAIIAAEQRWRVDRRAIAEVVMYEAIQNPEPLASLILSRFAGPGKLHYKAERFSEGEPVTKEVEDLGYLPRRSVGARKTYLETDAGSIEYIGAIFRAFSDLGRQHGYSLSCDVPMLGTFYSSWTLAEARSFWTRSHPRMLRPNRAGAWMEQQIGFVQGVVGTPSRSVCAR